MTLEELRNHVANNITHCYLVKKSEIYKLEIGTIQGKKDVSSIYTSEPCSFTIGFKNPNNKGIWKPSYSIPFIDVMGINDNGKLILTDYKKGGYDLLNTSMTLHGDIFVVCIGWVIPTFILILITTPAIMLIKAETILIFSKILK